nr:MAG TPA: Terminase small subunit [Caudoviricetes sp.]
MNEGQRQFCEEYIIDFNGSQAAIRAGYSKNTANRIASRLLTNVDIQNYIKELIENRNKRTKITQDEVIADIIEVKNRCMQKVPVVKYDKEEKDYIQVQDEFGRDVWQFDANGANKALDMLMKHTGGYEKNNTQQSTSIIVNNNVVDDVLKKLKEL